MKGALGLLAVMAVIWVFWMSWEWLRNPDRRWKKSKKG
jgi:high-affinity Fe2+/Pb2+ permease